MLYIQGFVNGSVVNSMVVSIVMVVYTVMVSMVVSMVMVVSTVMVFNGSVDC